MAVVRGVVVADADTPDDTDLVDTEVTLKCRKEILLVLPAQWWLWWEHAQVSSYSYSIRDSRMIKILAYCELGTVTIMPSLSPNVVYHCDDVIWLDTAGARCDQIIAKLIGARGKSKDLDYSISLTVNFSILFPGTHVLKMVICYSDSMRWDYNNNNRNRCLRRKDWHVLNFLSVNASIEHERQPTLLLSWTLTHCVPFINAWGAHIITRL